MPAFEFQHKPNKFVQLNLCFWRQNVFTTKPQTDFWIYHKLLVFKCVGNAHLWPAFHSCARCTLRVNGRETCTDTVSQRTVWLRGPLIIRQGDRQTDRQTVPQRAQTGPGSWSRPDKYKEARGGGSSAHGRGGRKKINPAAAARLHRLPDNVLLQSGIKTTLCHKRQSDARRR